MATPADVVAGEVIEVEWGNSVRDFACFGIEFGGTTETAQDGSLSSTFEDGASVSFVKPSDWVEFKVLAWGGVNFWYLGASDDPVYGGRIVVGATNGTEYQANAQNVTAASFHVSPRAVVTGLSATSTVKVQYRGGTVATGTKHYSMVTFIAVRTS